jgi:hypothetical protein
MMSRTWKVKMFAIPRAKQRIMVRMPNLYGTQWSAVWSLGKSCSPRQLSGVEECHRLLFRQPITRWLLRAERREGPHHCP